MERKMKRAALVFVVFASGCAAGSQIRETVPPEGLGKYKVVFVDVSTDDPDNREAVAQLKTSIVGKLSALSCFENYETGSEPAKADLRLSAKVTGVRGVTGLGRFLFGAMAGKASVRADVQLVELATGEKVGAFSIEGKSSGGTVFAGTTTQAIEKTGEGVAEYINAHK